MYARPARRFALIVGLLLSSAAAAEHSSALIAVASNFLPTATKLQQAFAPTHDGELRISAAATGVHAAQIRSGAPYAAWLAADQQPPAQLEQDALIPTGRRFTYAIGRLALLKAPGNSSALTVDGLRTAAASKIAIANPRHAPYGLAALQVLQRWLPEAQLSARLVRGQSVAQAYQFAESGAADWALTAWPLAMHSPNRAWLIPAHLHAPIRQDAVMLSNNPTAQAFLEFLAGPAGRALIRADGYELPGR